MQRGVADLRDIILQTNTHTKCNCNNMQIARLQNANTLLYGFVEKGGMQSLKGIKGKEAN